MILYFVNGSHQKKRLLESDYADDLYDVMIGFFEEHGRYPHFLELEQYEEACEIHFESKCEYFLFEGTDEEAAVTLREMAAEYNGN